MTEEKHDYSKTVLLPVTDFPLKAGLSEREPRQLAAWEEQGTYQKLRALRKGAPKWILHDGPPFANGDIHMGHALNKTLKDVSVRYKSMRGFDAPFVPGWDCHGMPIEFKVLKDWPKDGPAKAPAEIRKRCRAEAEKWVARQREEFKRLGVWGDFEHPYLTMSKEFEAHQLDAYWELVRKGQIYRDLKPVYWCTHDHTALAEAELEYQDAVSDAVHVKFELAAGSAEKLGLLPGKSFLLIWTTTPWTLPANIAIAANADFDYAAYAVEGEAWVLAKGLAAKVFSLMNREEAPAILWEGKGRELEGLSYAPFLLGGLKDPAKHHRVALAPYVTLDAGTGLVHTAPGHGADDYVTGMRYGLEVYCPVDGAGRYLDSVGEERLKGLKVSDPNTNLGVMALLSERGMLAHHEKIAHSYPHCWRCKHPIIFRATEQWFMSLEKNSLRERTLAEIAKVEWVNAWGADRMANMMKDRADWCISRQRSWGVPIYMFYCQCGNWHFDEVCYKLARSIVEQEGSDAWFVDAGRFLPAGARCSQCGSSELKPGSDTIDVWFDSGSSHLAVLEARPELQWPADLYLEGSDQYRGWFQSSMLVAVGARGAAPYKAVASHGWVLDAKGHAMHKSAGNAIDPLQVMKTYGADIIRLWAASQDFMDDDRIGEDILKRTAESYRKLRNTLRWLLGSLEGFEPARDSLAMEAMQPIDRWLLGEAEALLARVSKAMDSLSYYQAVSELLQFSSTQLSGLAVDIHKDTLYTLARRDPARLSAQTALYRCLQVLVRSLAPILPFTCEEAWSAMPLAWREGAESVHLASWPAAQPGLADAILAEDFGLLFGSVRPVVTKQLEEERAAKRIGHPYDAEVALAPHSKALYKLLSRHEQSLAQYFVVSKVTLEPAAPQDGKELAPSEVRISVSPQPKCERCWRHIEDVGSHAGHPGLCGRCVQAIAQSSSLF
jgi:isoleucyl-tRNA synthetase